MNEIERKVLQRNHCNIVEVIEPLELRPFLYSKGVLPNPTFLGDDRVRTRRAEKFIEYIVENCSFSLFLDSLSKDSAYDFLAQKLQLELDDISKDDTESRYVPYEIKESLFTPERAKAIWFRHELKRYSMTGNNEAFLQRSKTITDRWNAIPKEKIFLENNQELADMYFMVLDATMERRRIVYDTTLYNDDELFGKMQEMSLYTSSATLPTAMRLARYGSALLMAGRPVEEALSYVEEAKQRLQTLPACRESGVILYIEYNMLISERYEKDPTVKMKNLLLKIGSESIDHFCREQETVGKDFRRMVLIKQALLLLGIGLFLNDVDNVFVTDEDKKQAETILQEIRKEENWKRMEHRWHVAYYVANSKLLRLEGQSEKALDEMQKASKYAIDGTFKKELGNIKKSVVFQSGKREWNFKNALLLFSFIILLIAVVYQIVFH
ncbi:uncharacterized protein LOC110442321 [Mizuhopecten yessoensis]|uniref:Uncharacterized protein n=1 Tax=Mizuhopecten yessoensis TaxID=6573 RepID=A0A210PHH9_MIZYE|nr:uncharacterized protein LOC110442321 [Mizuhopecten yessoensis]OWF35932.1 hypothetical protein KP79_PYT12198 [Mizuhopecten yessoensis]